jgi:hypothetical protein
VDQQFHAIAVTGDGVCAQAEFGAQVGSEEGGDQVAESDVHYLTFC